MPPPSTIPLPLPISLIQHHYLVFSPDSVSYLRRAHNILGVLTGSIPQAPQQNIFLGVPLELLPEEACLLVSKGVAFIVDEKQAHETGFERLKEAEKKAFLAGLEKEGGELMRIREGRKRAGREIALKRRGLNDMIREREVAENEREKSTIPTPASEESLFDSPALSSRMDIDPPAPSPSASTQLFALTPQTSYPPLGLPFTNPPSTPSTSTQSPTSSSGSTTAILVPPSYPLYAHLHARDYFMSPGLRFGCTYLVYPGDPLRFHSHFLAVGKGWNEEFNLMELVGGGRLGTVVKKSFLVGGLIEGGGIREGGEDVEKGGGDKEGEVRCFSIEWAAL